MFNKALKKAKENKKGFTLAELLIVVAIIAVLVAIAIPIFTAQLQKAKVATDEANIRSWYAEASAKLLTEDNYTPTTDELENAVDLKADGATVTVNYTEAATANDDPVFNITYTAEYANTNVTIPDGMN